MKYKLSIITTNIYDYFAFLWLFCIVCIHCWMTFQNSFIAFWMRFDSLCKSRGAIAARSDSANGIWCWWWLGVGASVTGSLLLLTALAGAGVAVNLEQSKAIVSNKVVDEQQYFIDISWHLTLNIKDIFKRHLTLEIV